MGDHGNRRAVGQAHRDSLPHLLRENARRFGARLAFADDRRRATWGELERRATLLSTQGRPPQIALLLRMTSRVGGRSRPIALEQWAAGSREHLRGEAGWFIAGGQPPGSERRVEFS